ncbi:MAG TPA: protein YgfX [Salinisphaeraceae bacterium]|nr:protein YgfX [Salinisphaeraceae bacterium]
MSNPFTATLVCRVRVSAQLSAINRCSHAAALAVILMLGLYRPLLLLLLPALAFSFQRSRGKIYLQSENSIVFLRWLPDDRLFWQVRDGREYSGHLRAAIVFGEHAAFLRLRPAHRRFATTALLLPRDSLAPHQHRRLRARLTIWQPPQPWHHCRQLLRQWLANWWFARWRRG